jgi:hypothetical protein
VNLIRLGAGRDVLIHGRARVNRMELVQIEELLLGACDTRRSPRRIDRNDHEVVTGQENNSPLTAVEFPVETHFIAPGSP